VVKALRASLRHTFFHPGENAIVALAGDGACRAMTCRRGTAKAKVAILHYPDGAGSAPHFDFCAGQRSNRASIERSGSRVSKLVASLPARCAGGRRNAVSAGSGLGRVGGGGGERYSRQHSEQHAVYF